MKKLEKGEKKLIFSATCSFILATLHWGLPVLIWCLTFTGQMGENGWGDYALAYILNSVLALIARAITDLRYKYYLAFGWVYTIFLSPLASIRLAYSQYLYTYGMLKALYKHRKGLKTPPYKESKNPYDDKLSNKKDKIEDDYATQDDYDGGGRAFEDSYDYEDDYADDTLPEHLIEQTFIGELQGNTYDVDQAYCNGSVRISSVSVNKNSGVVNIEGKLVNLSPNVNDENEAKLHLDRALNFMAQDAKNVIMDACEDLINYKNIPGSWRINVRITK